MQRLVSKGQEGPFQLHSPQVKLYSGCLLSAVRGPQSPQNPSSRNSSFHIEWYLAEVYFTQKVADLHVSGLQWFRELQCCEFVTPRLEVQEQSFIYFGKAVGRLFVCKTSEAAFKLLFEESQAMFPHNMTEIPVYMVVLHQFLGELYT